jgi:hypothetical protein
MFSFVNYSRSLFWICCGLLLIVQSVRILVQISTSFCWSSFIQCIITVSLALKDGTVPTEVYPKFVPNSRAHWQSNLGGIPFLETIKSAGTLVPNDVYCDDSSSFQIVQGPKGVVSRRFDCLVNIQMAWRDPPTSNIAIYELGILWLMNLSNTKHAIRQIRSWLIWEVNPKLLLFEFPCNSSQARLMGHRE